MGCVVQKHDNGTITIFGTKKEIDARISSLFSKDGYSVNGISFYLREHIYIKELGYHVPFYDKKMEVSQVKSIVEIRDLLNQFIDKYEQEFGNPGVFR